MLKLMRLELKKFNFKGYLFRYIISIIILLGLLLLIFYAASHPELMEGEINKQEVPESLTQVGMLIGILSAVTFTIFSSAILSRLVIGEFKNKTISLMFMYPINRKKIIASKLLIVSLFALLSILSADIILSCAFLFVNSFFHLITEKLTMEIIIRNLIGFVFQGISAAGISLIPLYFGMRKKSVPTTILSAVIIASIINGNIGDVNLSSIVIIPVSLALVGILVAYLSIRNIEHADVGN